MSQLASVGGKIKGAFNAAVEFAAPVLDPIKEKFQKLSETLAPYLAPVGEKIKGAFNAAVEFAAPALDPIKEKFSGLFGNLFKADGKDEKGFISKIGKKFKGLGKKFIESDIGKTMMPVAKDFLVGSMEGGQGLLPAFLGDKAGAVTKLLPKFMRKSAGGLVSKEGMGSLAGVFGNKLGITGFGGNEVSSLPTSPTTPTLPTTTTPTIPTPILPTTPIKSAPIAKNTDSSVKARKISQPITINVTVNVDNKAGKLDEKEIGDIVAKKIAEVQSEARAEARRSSFDY